MGMRSFFKIFFASFLSIVVFTMILFFLLVTLVSSLASKDRPEIAKKSVLVLDLSKHWEEKKREKPLANFSEEGDDPGLPAACSRNIHGS